MNAPVKPIAALDVPAEQLARDIARRKVEERLGRVGWLIRHPEWPTGRQSDGIAAEYRHLLDPALDYTHAPAAEEAAS
ncbi:hypothetical protein [Streptomyces chartreusis]|uniref:hypothetical protein n=1 Tax=Streptomyces chartreusis TaxID=1969 RepID=UPI00123C9084|nr:hypothetical protein [Streptomyces chartreusis]QEV66279.1 hypothetical protein CP983_06085 [Streptomyces chartreusis]GGW99203.1 hypothetical protein GCM10010321_12130 [Streptomyces chartreusis]